MPISNTPSPTSITISSLGELEGWYNPDDGTTQFFGVPYADLTARFRHSTAKTEWPGEHWDGKKLGGYSAQPNRPFYPFPMPARPHVGDSIIDELKCLNLHITLPRGWTQDAALPIIMFIHGGGFVFGTANYSILDGRPLANRSTEMDMPCIIITPNYRVGMYGFLASEDIKADNEAFGGGNGNQGFIDQQNAIRWVHKHARSLGADPSKILLTGQSAGAVSVDMHMRGPVKDLFSTAILQSGTVPICGIFSEAEYHIIYVKLLIACGVDTTLPPSERLAALRAVPHEVVSQNTYEVYQALNLPQFGPCHDGHVLGEGVGVPLPSWYAQGTIEATGFQGRVVVGDCMHEGIIYDQAFRDYSPEYAINLIKKWLPADLAKDTLSHYKITPDMDQRALYLAFEALVTDVLFTAPPYYLAKNNPDVFVYQWDHLSQFDNPWGGFAHHSLDYMWLFGGLDPILQPAEREMARKLQHDWITFANGGTPPYPAYGSSRTRQIYGPNSVAHVESGKSYINRPTEWFDRIQGHLEEFDNLSTEIITRRTELLSFEYGPGSTNLRKVVQGGPLAI